MPRKEAEEKREQDLKECLVEVEKRPYLRFYRHTEGKRELVPLNFSAVVID